MWQYGDLNKTPDKNNNNNRKNNKCYNNFFSLYHVEHKTYIYNVELTAEAVVEGGYVAHMLAGLKAQLTLVSVRDAVGAADRTELCRTLWALTDRQT